MHDLSLFCFNHGFEFQYTVRNGCHELSMQWINISDIAIITVKNVDYGLLVIKLANLKQLIY